MLGRCVTSDQTHNNLFYQHGVCLVAPSVLLTAGYSPEPDIKCLLAQITYIICCCSQLRGYNYYPSDATSLLASSRPCKPSAAVKAIDGRFNTKESYTVKNNVIYQ